MSTRDYVKRWAVHAKAVSHEGWLQSYLRYRGDVVGHENRDIFMLVERGEGSAYYARDELERARAIGLDFYLDAEAVALFLRASDQACKRHAAVCRELAREPYERLSRPAVATILERFLDHYMACVAYYKVSGQEFCAGVEDYLRDGLRPIFGDADDAIRTLMTEDRSDLATTRERRSWIELLRATAGLDADHPEVNAWLTRHLEQFGFLGAHGGTPQGWSLGDLRERFEGARPEGNQTIDSHGASLERDLAIERRRSEMLERLADRPQLVQVARNVASCTQQRMQVREVFTLGAHLSNSLFQYVYSLVREASGRDLDKEVLRQLGRDESVALLRDGRPVDVDRLQEKYHASAYVLGDDGVTIEVGPRALSLKPTPAPERPEARATRGMVVFADGRVRGPATVIGPGLHTRDKLRIAAAMVRGGVLVTGMTHPNIMVACEKAAAIVTDDGGITCHAAIVARELQIPCIVGTQNATSIFSSGELIEVDSLKGWVRSVEA